MKANLKKYFPSNLAPFKTGVSLAQLVRDKWAIAKADGVSGKEFRAAVMERLTRDGVIPVADGEKRGSEAWNQALRRVQDTVSQTLLRIDREAFQSRVRTETRERSKRFTQSELLAALVAAGLSRKAIEPAVKAIYAK